MHALTQHLLDWYSQSLASGGYPLIILLMAMESSLIPLPSEFVIPPAVLLASGHGHMTVPGIVLAATFGCWVGATVMYGVSRAAGRPLLMKLSTALDSRLTPRPLSAKNSGSWLSRLMARFVRFFLITPEQIEKAERWSARFGSFGIFGSRMLPVIRHLIGIPCGIVRFNFVRYSLYTVIGSLLWCSVLAWVSVLAGNNAALMSGDLKTVTIWIAGAVVVLGGLYYFFVYRFTREAPERGASRRQ